MRIDYKDYYNKLYMEFKDDVSVFCEVLTYFDCPSKVGEATEFNGFWSSYFFYKNTEGNLYNYSYELYNNISRFYTGGVYKLFKFKQAEWGAPEILITKNDVPEDSEVYLLDNLQTIYRGLDKKEHESKNYFQSWTTSKEIANNFANDTYNYKSSGIVVQGQIPKNHIIYYKDSDYEKEVIVEKGKVINIKEL